MTKPEDDRPICPRCHLPAVPILYGYPSEQGAELLHIGRVAGGGCVIMPDAPTLACPHGHRWRPAAGPGTPVLPVAGSTGDDDVLLVAARRYVAGDLAGAEDAYRSIVRAAGETLGAAHPDTLALRYALAIVLYRAGRLADGEAEYRGMRAAAGRPLTVRPWPNLAELEAIMGLRPLPARPDRPDRPG